MLSNSGDGDKDDDLRERRKHLLSRRTRMLGILSVSAIEGDDDDGVVNAGASGGVYTRWQHLDLESDDASMR